MNQINKRNEAILLIILSIVLLAISFTKKGVTLKDTENFSDILIEKPTAGSRDGGVYPYVSIKIKNNKNHFEFNGCSYSEFIEKKLMKLDAGDKIDIYARMTSAITFDGKITYEICDAKIDKLGHIITLENYNSCYLFKWKRIVPIISILLLVIGIHMWNQSLIDNNNKTLSEKFKLILDRYLLRLRKR